MGKSDNSMLEELNKRLDEMVSAATMVTREWLSIWQDGLDYVFNNQLREQKRRDGWERVQVNRFWPAVRQNMAMLAQRRPQILALPFEGNDTEGAEQNQALLQWQFNQDLNFPISILPAAYLDAAIYGMYVAKVFWEPKPFRGWNPETKQWEGRVRVNLIHPAYFGSDPEAEKLDDASFVLSKRRVDTQWAKWKWPVFADEIQEAANREPDSGDDWGLDGAMFNPSVESTEEQADVGPSSEAIEGRIASMVAQARGHQWKQTDSSTGVQAGSRVTIEEIYWRDHTERNQTEYEPIPVDELLATGQAVEDEIRGVPYAVLPNGELLTRENQPTRTAREYSEPMYPMGRYALRLGCTDSRTGVGPAILNPKDEDQVWPYRHWPFVTGVNYILPHMQHGMNDVEMGRGLQDWLNVSASHMINHVKCFGDPQVKVEVGALQNDPENQNVAAEIANRAGAVIKIAKGKMTGVEREPGVSMSNTIPKLYEVMSDEFRDVIAMQEVSLGHQTPGNQTAYEVGQREASSRLPNSLRSLFMDHWTVKVFQTISELNQRNMTEGQRVRITGDKGERREIAVTPVMLDARYDLKLEVGMAMPYDRDRKKGDYFALFDKGIPLHRELLELCEVDNVDEVLARHGIWPIVEALMQLPNGQEVAQQILAQAEQTAQMQMQQEQGAIAQ